MSEKVFKVSVGFVAVLFTIIFLVLMIPPLMDDPDIIGAFAKGFVNPFAAGYSTDVIACWVILLLWVIYESPKIKHGWICIVLGLIPGVAVGFALYLIMRMNQLTSKEKYP